MLAISMTPQLVSLVHMRELMHGNAHTLILQILIR